MLNKVLPLSKGKCFYWGLGSTSGNILNHNNRRSKHRIYRNRLLSDNRSVPSAAEGKLPPASVLLRFGLGKLNNEAIDNVMSVILSLFLLGWNLLSFPASHFSIKGS